LPPTTRWYKTWARPQGPDASHWFGTDEYGRDIYSRIIYGSRITLYVISLVTIVVGPVGLAVGTISGYFGGKVDTLFMRITDIFISFPSLILALAFVAALGPRLDHTIVAIALTAWHRLHVWHARKHYRCALRISLSQSNCKGHPQRG